MQAKHKVLNSWTVMEETQKESIAGSGCEMEHDEENSSNCNDKQSDDDHGEHCDNGNENDAN